MSTSILTHGRVTWTSIVNPTDDDIQQLAARYPHFHPLNLNDCRSETEFPKLDHHDDYVFLVMHFPLWDAVKHIARPAEIDIFIAKGTLVTAHTGELQPLLQLWNRAQADEGFRAELLGRGASPLLYDLLNTCMLDSFPLAKRLDHDVRHLEEDLFNEDVRHTLNEMAVTRRALIGLRGILRPQLDIVRGLAAGSWSFIHEDLDLYWGDISDHLAQLCATLDQHIEVVAGLSETIDTLASHRIDEVVRVLTVVTVLTLPLTVLSTIFSMNVALPYERHPGTFFAVIGWGLGLTGILIWYLRRRRWI